MRSVDTYVEVDGHAVHIGKLLDTQVVEGVVRAVGGGVGSYNVMFTENLVHTMTVDIVEEEGKKFAVVTEHECVEDTAPYFECTIH